MVEDSCCYSQYKQYYMFLYLCNKVFHNLLQLYYYVVQLYSTFFVPLFIIKKYFTLKLSEILYYLIIYHFLQITICRNNYITYKSLKSKSFYNNLLKYMSKSSSTLTIVPGFTGSLWYIKPLPSATYPNLP